MPHTSPLDPAILNLGVSLTDRYTHTCVACLYKNTNGRTIFQSQGLETKLIPISRNLIKQTIMSLDNGTLYSLEKKNKVSYVLK